MRFQGISLQLSTIWKTIRLELTSVECSDCIPPPPLSIKYFHIISTENWKNRERYVEITTISNINCLALCAASCPTMGRVRRQWISLFHAIPTPTQVSSALSVFHALCKWLDNPLFMASKKREEEKKTRISKMGKMFRHFASQFEIECKRGNSVRFGSPHILSNFADSQATAQPRLGCPKMSCSWSSKMICLCIVSHLNKLIAKA